MPEGQGPLQLLAAAARYTVSAFGPRVARADTSWQGQAWQFWDEHPEVRFAGSWVGNAMGRARLYAGKRLPDGSVDPLPPEHPASVLVASIGGGPSGQAQLLAQYGPQLVVAGEAWTVIDEDRWYVVSTQEVRERGKDMEVEIEGKLMLVPMEPDDMSNPNAPLAVRVWQPHPKRHQNADSPIRSSFTILEELRLLNAAVASIASSRLRGRGVLFLEQGSNFPSAQGAPGPSPDVIGEFISAATTAYRDPSSAAAGVPLVMEVPSGTTFQPSHVTFESDFDDLAVKLREECIRRFATGIDFPGEILLGTGDASHWAAWSFDDAGNRQAVFPRLRTVCDGWTTGWLVPALKAMSALDAGECVIWYDDTDLRVQTNRSETAVLLYDRGEIDGDALRRETNFDETDMPIKEERDRRLLEGIVRDAPSTAPIILPLLGINVPGLAEAMQPFTPTVEGFTEGDDAEVVDIPVAEDPGPPKVSEGLMAAADRLVVRAMERAGQKLKSKTPRAQRGELEKIEAAAVHVATGCCEDDIVTGRLLDKAWDDVPEIAHRYDVDPTDLTACLDRYTRELLCAGVEHAWEQTSAALAPLTVTLAESEPVAEAS